MKELIYKLFKANFERYDVCFPKELMDIIDKTETVNDFVEIHKFLDDNVSPKLAGDAIFINKCINACKNDLKILRKISK